MNDNVSISVDPTRLAAFEGQMGYVNSGKPAVDGSMAIALGRAAGLAMETGRNEEAVRLWSELQKLGPATNTTTEGRFGAMPKIDQMYAGYKANPAKFAEFGRKDVYPATEGLAFSNAMGSYAFALDCMRRGEEAFRVKSWEKKGDREPTAYYGAAALRAAGFDWLAPTLASDVAPTSSLRIAG